MRRLPLVLLLILGLAPGTCFREPRAPRNSTLAVAFSAVPLPHPREAARHLGAFELEQVWEMNSAYTGFGAYSALLVQPGGRLMAIGDSGLYLTFSPPGAPRRPPEAGAIPAGPARSMSRDRDIEAATQDPATGAIWTAREDSNSISRYDPVRHAISGYVRPAPMRGWRNNFGPEAMVRLADGRFIVLQESPPSPWGSRLHRAVLFPRDPALGGKPVSFRFAGAPGFSPTDMAALPDGRVLILMRRLVWPFPLRFACRILIADPAAIREGEVWPGTVVAKLASTLPVDNFEGMAIEPRAANDPNGGRVTVWLISDRNHAATQRTLLWKMAVDPTRLPGAGKTARE